MKGLCSSGAAGDGRAPTEELASEIEGGLCPAG